MPRSHAVTLIYTESDTRTIHVFGHMAPECFPEVCTVQRKTASNIGELLQHLTEIFRKQAIACEHCWTSSLRTMALGEIEEEE
jgi:hypothetical protein